MTNLSSATSLLVALTAAGLMTSCCNSQNCAPCEPLGTDDVRVAFSTDTLGGTGFRQAELRDAYLVRYTGRNLTGTNDTIRQGARPNREPLSFYGGSFGFRQLPLLIPSTTGSGSGASTFDPNDYSYRLVVPATGHQFAFSELETAIDLGKGCCACPRNTRRRFVLNGQYTVADGSEGTITYLSRFPAFTAQFD